jgi:hypothetical protein
MTDELTGGARFYEEKGRCAARGEAGASPGLSTRQRPSRCRCRRPGLPHPHCWSAALYRARGIRRRRRDLTADAGRWSLSAAGERDRAVATPMRCRQQNIRRGPGRPAERPEQRRSRKLPDLSVQNNNKKKTEKQIPSPALRHTYCSWVHCWGFRCAYSE